MIEIVKLPRPTDVWPSLIDTLTEVVPLRSAAGVNVSVPPELIDGPLAKSDGVPADAVNVTVCDSPGPGEMFATRPASTAAPASSATVSVAWSRSPDGGSLTAETVMVTVTEPDDSLFVSSAWYVKESLPKKSGSGV